MRQKILLILALILTFGAGVAFQKIRETKRTNTQKTMKRVTGIGGIFFKCKDPKAMTAWYAKHLGLETNEYGAVFHWKHQDDSTKNGYTQWTPFPETTKYFDPSPSGHMINYTVENLEALIEELKKEGVVILDDMETYDFGKFIHIQDPEGNKVELWEPMGE